GDGRGFNSRFRNRTGPEKHTNLTAISVTDPREKPLDCPLPLACQPPLFAAASRTYQLAGTPVSRTFNGRLVQAATPPCKEPPKADCHGRFCVRVRIRSRVCDARRAAACAEAAVARGPDRPRSARY